MFLIIPYFNFNNNNNTKEINSLNLFIKQSRLYNNVETVLVEGIYGSNCLPDYSDRLFLHIKKQIPNVMWIKENLLNIAVQHLPENWSSAVVVDRDTFFCNQNWATECEESLNYYDVVQPWSSYYFLDKNNNIDTQIKIRDNNDGFVKRIYEKNCIRGHPGFSWGFSRKFYSKIGSFFDKNIVGGGDTIFTHGLISGLLRDEDLLLLFERQFSSTYKRCIDPEYTNYINKAKNSKFGYLEGTVLHYYHGSIENRQYNSRYDYLCEKKYNCSIDTFYNCDKVLCLTDSGLRLESDIKKYFELREKNNDRP